MVADLRMASPAAVELVNPKHRNERKYRMALITSYNVPGLYVEDHSIDVPLDWRGLEPMLLAVGNTMRRGAMPAPIAGAPESIKLFYRVVCAPDRINDDLPLLLFCRAALVARARVRSHPRATAGLRKPSNTSAWSFPTSAARGAAAV